MPRISTFLMFDGRAHEAVSLYVSLFPDLSITSLQKYGPDGPGKEGSVQLASFTLNGTPFMAIDSPVPHEFTFTPATSIYVSCASEEEVTELYGVLSEGGEVFMPLDTYPFSKKFAWIADHFGVSWQISVG
jgi:predicted 3-demethylubiquinone-9 3-methyltransferase (glyoxalase superfamily)